MIEQQAATTGPALCDAEVVTRTPVHLCGIRAGVDLAALRDFPRHMLPVVARALRRVRSAPAGPPVTMIRLSAGGTGFLVTAAYPTTEPLVLGQPFVHTVLPGGRVVQAVHVGPWHSLLSTYDRLNEWLTAHRIGAPSLMWEEYLVGPEAADDAAVWRTRVVVPLPVS